MLAQVRKHRKNILVVLFCAFAMTLASCASQSESVRLVDDPDDHRDSSITWNRQEKWETAPDVNQLGPTGSRDSRRYRGERPDSNPATGGGNAIFRYH